MLTCTAVKDLSRFFCVLQDCVSVGYDKFMFQERYAHNTINP